MWIDQITVFLVTNIENAELIEGLFGHWPSFHDAELRAVRLEAPRGAPVTLELEIEIAETSSEVDEQGYYRDRCRCLASFRFGNVLNASLVDFRHQNVLDVFEVIQLSGSERESAGEGWGARRYRVRLLPIPAFCEMEFLCDSLEVTSVVPVTRTA